MRPTPAEIIQSVRALLRERIGPAVNSEAEADLKRVMAALRECRWNEAAFDLLRENTVLTKLIEEILAAASAAQRPAEVVSGLREAARLHASRGVPRSFDEANEINHALRQALAAFCEAMRDSPLKGDDPLGHRIAEVLLQLLEPTPHFERSNAS
jgi:hypothetical protein